MNINTADVDELMTLDGVGEATAKRIVEDRQANGPFATIEDLKRVSGIGDKKFGRVVERDMRVNSFFSAWAHGRFFSMRAEACADGVVEDDPGPRRPSIPPVFVVMGSLLGIMRGRVPRVPACRSEDVARDVGDDAFGSLCLAARLVLEKRASPAAVVLIGVLLGLLCASSGAWRMQFSTDMLDGAAHDWTVVLAEDIGPGLHGSSGAARVIGVDGVSFPVEVRSR